MHGLKIAILAGSVAASAVLVGCTTPSPAPEPARFVIGAFDVPRDADPRAIHELRQRLVAQILGKAESTPELDPVMPAITIARAAEPTEVYGVDSARFAEQAAAGATTLAAGADWVTLDECKAKFDSGFSGSYWYKNKFSWCRSQARIFPIIEMPSGRPIADVFHTLTYIGRGGNGQRTLDLQIRISNWAVQSYDTLWNEIRPGLVFQFWPDCAPGPGSACGDIFPLGQPFAEFPAMVNGDRDYWFLPTTTVPIQTDNPQDNKGYYQFFPKLRIIHTTGLVTTSSNNLPSDRFRCDNATYGNSLGSGGGCVFTNITSFLQLSCDDPAIRESACFIKDAFEDITRTYPGIPGTYVPGKYGGTNGPLTRNYHQNNGINNTSRDIAIGACEAGYGDEYSWRPDSQRNDCDEYPFLKTYQNANAPVGGSARSFAVRPLLSDHNQEVGRRLASYYAGDRILDGDPFYIKVVGSCPAWSWAGAPPASTKKIMVVGDSISQGNEGDYTWRYRLANHLAASGAVVNFVGPYHGTTRLPPAQPPGFPSVSAPAVFDGDYRNSIQFDSDHFAQWGRQAAQAKNEMRAKVAQYRPDYLLVELGFNDLGWGVSDPDGLIADIMTLIAEARFSNPSIRILVANVPHRTPLFNVPNLPRITESYNSKLGPMLAWANTSQSPLRLVNIDGVIDPWSHTTDGLHPNGIGEYRIARAFADVLASQFSVGQPFGAIPSSVPDLVPSAPAWMNAVATPVGINLSWAHSFGAGGYWLYQRDATVGGSFERLPLPIPADSWRAGWLQNGHRYEFYVVPMHGIIEGGQSVPTSAVANLLTASGPSNILVTPSASFVDFSWTRPTGPFSDTVSGYTLYYFDQTAYGSIVQQQRVNATSYRLTGLVTGHKYTFVVASINAAGEGFPAVAPDAILGYGRPAAPTLQAAQILSPTDVEVRWSAVPGATNYNVLYRDRVAGGTFSRNGIVTTTSQSIGWLFPGADRWEWCVIAANGSLESATSQCIWSQLDPPTLLGVRKLSPTDVDIRWTAVPGATKYRILHRNILNGGGFTLWGEVGGTNLQIGWLFPGVQYFEWCVAAATDNIQSATSNCMMTQL